MNMKILGIIICVSFSTTIIAAEEWEYEKVEDLIGYGESYGGVQLITDIKRLRGLSETGVIRDEQTNTRVQNNKNSIEEIIEDNKRLETLYTIHGRDIGNINTDNKKRDEETTVQNERISHNVIENRERKIEIGALQRKNTIIEDRITNNETEIERIGKEIMGPGGFDERISTSEENIETNNERISTSEENIGINNERISTNEEYMELNRLNLMAIHANTNTNRDGMSQNKSKIADNVEEIDRIESYLSSNIQDNTDKITQHTATLENHYNRISDVQLTTIENSENIKTNKKSSDENSENIKTNKKSAERHQNEISKNRSEISTNSDNVKINTENIKISESRHDFSEEIDTFQNKIIYNNRNRLNEYNKTISVVDAFHERLDSNAGNIEHNRKRINFNQSSINENAASISSNRKEAIHGIAIAMASTINMPKKGKKLNLTISVGQYQEAKAISISGSAKINRYTDVFFGIGRTNDREYTASKIGASFDW